MTLTVILFGLIAVVAEVVGGTVLLARRQWPRRTQEFLLALGAGFLLALVFAELIPRSVQALGATAGLVIILGFATIHFFEHTVVKHLHFGEEVHPEVMVSRAASVSAFSGLFVHAFFDGLSISAGMHFQFLVGLLIFCAILLHKVPEGLTIASIMLTAGYSRRTVLLASLGIGAATMIGVLMILIFANVDAQVTGIAFAFSAGAAAYVGASDLIPEINRSENRIAPIVVFGGMLLFYITAKFLEKVITG
ncbi:MAG: ZIP family metal transporter [Bacteroidota bacterium]